MKIATTDNPNYWFRCGKCEQKVQAIFKDGLCIDCEEAKKALKKKKQ